MSKTVSVKSIIRRGKGNQIGEEEKESLME